MNKNVRFIARLGMIAALVVTAFTIDSLISMAMAGMPIKIAVTVLIVSLTVCQLFDLKTAVATTTVFGLVSWLYSAVFPNLSSQAFWNPLVSVAPRIVIGFTCYATFSGMRRLCGNANNTFVRELLPRAVSGAVGILTNTILVLTMIALFDNGNVLNKVLSVVISLNFLIEISCGLLVVPAVSFAVRNQVKKMKI